MTEIELIKSAIKEMKCDCVYYEVQKGIILWFLIAKINGYNGVLE